MNDTVHNPFVKWEDAPNAHATLYCIESCWWGRFANVPSSMEIFAREFNMWIPAPFLRLPDTIIEKPDSKIKRHLIDVKCGDFIAFDDQRYVVLTNTKGGNVITLGLIKDDAQDTFRIVTLFKSTAAEQADKAVPKKYYWSHVFNGVYSRLEVQ